MGALITKFSRLIQDSDNLAFLDNRLAFMATLKDKLEVMAMTPRTQFKRLAIGTLAGILVMGLMWVTASLESDLVFYFLVFCLTLSILYAVPGYLGVWLWRMRDTLFKKPSSGNQK